MTAPSTSVTNYMRFSSASFTIQEQLNLTSDDLVIGVIETVILEAIKSDDSIQNIVRCGIAAA